MFLTGLLLAQRGIGTMLSMMIVGRLSTKIDPRLNMATGLIIMAAATYLMSGFDTQINTWPLIWTGFVQEIGMGQVFVPLTTVSFSTLPAHQRTEGTGIYNLIRNIGGSLGISVAFTLLVHERQVNHTVLGSHITPFNQVLHLVHAPINLHSMHSLAVLNGVVNQQASMISFNDDFVVMSLLAILVLPLVFLMQRPVYSKPTKERKQESPVATEPTPESSAVSAMVIPAGTRFEAPEAAAESRRSIRYTEG